MLMMLMYHRLLPHPHPEAVTVAQFHRQMDYLERHYDFLTPEEVLAYLKGDLPKSNRPCVALSFDDGWLDNWLFATPLLQERNLRATLAVSTGFMQEGKLRRTETDAVLYQPSVAAEQNALQGDRSAYVNFSELKAMADSGVWRLEAHGITHQQDENGISVLARPQKGESEHDFKQRLQDEVHGCCQTLQDISGYQPQMFFWPWGHYSRMAKRVIRKLSLVQFGVRKGIIKQAESRRVLPRVGVSARWRKFCKNCLVFRSPTLRAAYRLFSRSPAHLRQLPKAQL